MRQCNNQAFNNLLSTTPTSFVRNFLFMPRNMEHRPLRMGADNLLIESVVIIDKINCLPQAFER